MSYWIKDGSSFIKNCTVNISADSETSYVSVCWLGVIRDDSNSCIADDIQTYCESVYIGLGDCDEKPPITGTIQWNDCVITYNITQEKAKCEKCEPSACTCEVISSRVAPYIIEPKSQELSGITEYWFTSGDTCGNIIREKRIDIETFQCPSEISGYTCDEEDRELSLTWDFNASTCTDCHQQMTGSCYVAMPENCCDMPSGVCYEVGEVYYINSAGTLITDVSQSGETIYFYFDYKKIETDDKCNTKTSFGRFDGKTQNVPWVIGACKDSECCRASGVTSAYTWTNHKSCETNDVIEVPLSITRKRDINYSGDCSNVCDPDTGYCVDTTSIKKYYKDINGNWIEVTDDYAFPYYGGSMKVTWEYSAITVYDDCTSGVTSGNEYEDIVDILPYDGDDCYDETKCYTVTLSSQSGNKCDGGKAEFNVSKNTSQIYVTKNISYKFKKSPCDFSPISQAVLPQELLNCSDESSCSISSSVDSLDCSSGIVQFSVSQSSSKCNEFEVSYKQNKRPCKDDCGTCVTTSRYKLEQTIDQSFNDTYSQNCTIRLIDSPYWVSVNVGSGTISYSVEANSGSDREGGVTFQVNGTNCYDTVIIWQKGENNDEDSHEEDPEVVCDCDSATFDVYQTNMLPSNGGSNLVIGSYIYDDCVSDVDVEGGGGTTCTISSSVSSLNCSGGVVEFSISESSSIGGGIPTWLSNITFNEGFIYADVTPNDDSQNERIGNLNVTYSTSSGQCSSKTLKVTQNKGNCSMTLISDGTEICWEDGGSVTFTPQY